MNSNIITATGHLTGESSKYGEFTAIEKVVHYPSYPPPHSELRIIGNTPYGGGSHGVILVIKRSEIHKGEYKIADDTDITAIYGHGEPSYFGNTGILTIDEFKPTEQYVKGSFNFRSLQLDGTVTGTFELNGFKNTSD